MKLKIRVIRSGDEGVIQIVKVKSQTQRPIKGFIYADEKEKLEFWIDVLKKSGSFELDQDQEP